MTKKSPDAPPAYSTPSTNPNGQDNTTPPPNYAPLTRFTIGKSTTPEPLVSLLEIKGHLALLHAFAELKRHVRETLVVDVPHVGEDDREKKWTWFVGLAVERFDLWCRSLDPKDSSKPWHVVLPPTDVLMVWHAYMLNPRWYAEDCMRIPECQTLRLFEPHFKMLLRDLSFNLVMNAPSKERFAFWVRTTHRAGFDPLEEARVATKKKKVVMCLNRCAGGTEVDLMNKEGTGYFQKNFRATCIRQGCPYTKITRETLALRKLAENLAERDDSALPGTLFTSSPADREKGRKIKQKIYDEGILKYVHHTEQNKEGLVIPIMKSCSYSLAKLREQMGAKEQPVLIERIMSAYNDGNIYSVELIGAVLRQGSFVSKMHELGWTSPGFFDKYADELALHHALARYHAFLDLMSSSLASFFVPTLDIDLVWHTHQLMPGKYDADCKDYLQRFIDHDDKVESMKLSSAFDITCRVWKERFRVQYTHCGCPIPGDSIGQRLSRIVGMHSRPPPTSSHLVPLGRPDALAATHASDHNAVRFLSNSLTGHRLAMMRQELLARKKMRKDQELENKKAAKQKLDSRIEELKAAKVRTKIIASLKSNTGPPSSRPPPPSRSNNHDDEGPATNSQTHRYCHGAPFLLPVPLFFGGTDGGGGGCVADGHTVSSGGACSSRGACFGGGVGVGAAGACASGSGAGGCGGSGGHDSGVHHGHHGFSCGAGSSSGGATCGGGSGGGGSTCGSSSGCGGGGGGCGGGGGGGGCGGC